MLPVLDPLSTSGAVAEDTEDRLVALAVVAAPTLHVQFELILFDHR